MRDYRPNTRYNDKEKEQINDIMEWLEYDNVHMGVRKAVRELHKKLAKTHSKEATNENN